MPASAPKPVRTGWPTLIGEGDAFVLGLPSGFSLQERLIEAAEIRVATAFGHYAGWKHIKQAIENSNASVSLLTGSEFFQTEPALLKSWFQLMHSSAMRVTAKLAAENPFFHPKVLIVIGRSGSDFAIVGSGNLSDGGLQNNVECSVHVEDPGAIRKLLEWFDSHFDCGVKLNRRVIDRYERKYNENRRRRDALQNDERDITKELVSIGRAEMKEWDKAVNAALAYFQTEKFKRAYEGRQKAAPRLLASLGFPRFNFDRRGFDTFFEIGELGQLDARWKNKVFGRRKLLKKALRNLISNPETALADLLDNKGKQYVPGVRLNFVSKLLAAYDSTRWPVFNSRVEAALRSFRYQPARGSGVSGKYLAYRDLMKIFIEACKRKGAKNVDALALDAFFYHWSRKLQRRKA